MNVYMYEGTSVKSVININIFPSAENGTLRRFKLGYKNKNWGNVF